MDRRGAFDYILLETTGLADPGNIAPLFWVDEGLGSTIYLDGVVTLVDAKNFLRCLADRPASHAKPQPPSAQSVLSAQESHTNVNDDVTLAHLQVSHADVVVINKSDLVSTIELDTIVSTVRGINALAKIHVASYSKVPKLEGVLLDLHAYDNVTAEDIDFASKGHSHLDEVSIAAQRCIWEKLTSIDHHDNCIRNTRFQRRHVAPSGRLASQGLLGFSIARPASHRHGQRKYRI